MIISSLTDDFEAGLALLVGEETIGAAGIVIGAAGSAGAAAGTRAGRGTGATAALGAAACRGAVVDVVGCLGLALAGGAEFEDAGCDCAVPPLALVGGAGAGAGMAGTAWFPWWWPLPPVAGG